MKLFKPPFHLRRLRSVLKRLSATLAFFIIILLQLNARRRTHRNFVNGETILSQHFTSNIIVSEINRFIFCPVPKAANSNWKYLIRKFEGYHDYSNLTKAHNHNTSGLRYLSDYSPLEVERLLTDQTFFKFIFVRNPYKRLVSCYMDKFLNSNNTYLRTEYRSFLAQLFSWHHARKLDIYHQPRPSFQSFVDELTKQEPAHMNAHWMPQMIHCGLGVIPYDFIGRMEHLDQHVSHVLKTIGRTDDHFPSQEEIGFLPSGTTTSAITALYNADLVTKVSAIYDMDLGFLGYDKCKYRRDLLSCIAE